MLTLILLRHAKSSWDTPGEDDFARGLAPRGRAAAPRMGEEMRRLSLKPHTVLCSPAVRTRDTLALVLPYLDPAPANVHFEDDLYLASGQRIHDRLRRLANDCPAALVIGHNPGLHNLALTLAEPSDDPRLSAMRDKFPTAALAVFTFQTPEWRQIKPQTGRLVHFATPRGLRDA